MHDLSGLFAPRGCAVLGASTDPEKAGHQIVVNMQEAGYARGLYPVNPRGEEVCGLSAYTRLCDIPGPVELAISAVPARFTGSLIEDLRARQSERGDLQVLVVVAAGYAEARTEEGQRAQDDLLAACTELGIRVLGPNCVGVVDNVNGLDTTFIAQVSREPGGISFLSQSGAMGAWLMQDWASRTHPVGFNKFISVGNMSDLDLLEILDYLRQDPDTSVVGLYLEGYVQGRRLAESFRRLAREKPVVVLKVGRSSHGAKAAQSHTGSMAGSDQIYDGMFKQTGVRRVQSVEELSDVLQAFDRLPRPAGRNVFLVTQAGGPGIYCTDVLEEGGEVRLARVREETRQSLRTLLPPFASVCQPEGHADITAAATAEQHAAALARVLEDDGVDSAILVTVPVLFMPGEAVAQEMVRMRNVLAERGVDKPILSVLLSGEPVREGVRILEENDLLTFSTPDRAARALSHLVAYEEFRWEVQGDD